MINQPNDSSSSSVLGRFLTGINESVFLTKLGIANIELVNYLNGLLIQFIRADAILIPNGKTDHTARKIIEMLDVAETSMAPERRDIYQAIGDYTLFWVGVYPESLNKRQTRQTTNWIHNFTRQGKKCYALASEMKPAALQPSEQVLHCLSQQYELCAFGLRESRREWEQYCSQPSQLIF